MAPRLLNLERVPDWLPRAAEHLRQGGVLAFPTETVYGLACSAFSPVGLAALFDLKGRERGRPLPVQVDSLRTALAAGFRFGPGAERLAREFWPGPLTLVLPRPASLPSWYAPENDSVALRIPDHPVALAVLREAGVALAVTSANLSGEPPLTDAPSVAHAFAAAEGLVVLDGGPATGGVASTVLDVTGDAPALVRGGPIPLERLLEVWHGRG